MLLCMMGIPSQNSAQSNQVSGSGTKLWQGALVGLIALLVRLIHVWSTADVPTAQHLIGDAAGYHDWARQIAEGNWLGDRAFYQAPLYPYLLAVWRLFGSDSTASIRVIQAVLGSVASAMLFLAASKLFCPRVGLMSGLMLALYAPAIYFDGLIQKASLDCLLVCTMLACLAAVKSRPSIRQCTLLGAIVSFLCLTRENAIVWHFVQIPWLLGVSIERQASARASGGHPPTASRELKFAALVAYLFGAALIFLPVGLRNYYVQGQFLLTTAQAGPNFYMGNNANADGRYQPLVRGHETPEFEQADATRLAEEAKGRPLTPREVSRYWMRRAWSDIAANPLQWLKLTGYKLLLVWNQYEIADAESMTIYRRHSPVLNVLSTLWNFGGLAPLAVLGIALTWNNRRRLWILYALIIIMTLAVAAFYVLARYRYPLVPLLIPFAAAGCVELWHRRLRLHTVIQPLSIAIAVALLVNWPIQDESRLDALAEMNAGVALAQAGEIQRAADYFANAVAMHSSSAEANYNLALAFAVQGKYAEAIPYYKAAVQFQPDLVGANFNLAVALERAGKSAEARRHYEIAVRQNPADVEAQAALKRLSGARPGE